MLHAPPPTPGPAVLFVPKINLLTNDEEMFPIGVYVVPGESLGLMAITANSLRPPHPKCHTQLCTPMCAAKTLFWCMNKMISNSLYRPYPSSVLYP